MFNIHKELSSLEEAVEFAEKMAEEEAEGFEEITDMEFSLSPEQLKQLRDEFLDRAKSYIVSIIKDLWITRNDEIE